MAKDDPDPGKALGCPRNHRQEAVWAQRAGSQCQALHSHRPAGEVGGPRDLTGRGISRRSFSTR